MMSFVQNHLRIESENRFLISSNIDEGRQVLAHEVEPSHVQRGRDRPLRGQRHRHEDQSRVG